MLTNQSAPFTEARFQNKNKVPRCIKVGNGPLKYVFKRLAASSLSFLFSTMTAWIVLDSLKLFTKPVVGILSIFSLVKQTEGFMAENWAFQGPRLAKNDHTSAIADHVNTTGHNNKWNHFDILASGKTDCHCKIKQTLLIQELKPRFVFGNWKDQKIMLVMTNYAKNYASTIYQSLLTVCLFFLESILSDFERSLSIFTLGWVGGGGGGV